MENMLSSCDDHRLFLNNNNIIIPEDVLIQILVLLPVLSLLRLKSVCKSWRALIQSSFFIDLHLNTTTNNNKKNNFGTFIVLTSHCVPITLQDYKRESEAFMLSGGGGGSEEEEELIKLEDLGFPLSYMVPTFDYMYMVGSINGLICIHETKGRDVYLWNPATRQFRILPKSLTSLEEGIPGDLKQDFVAFGYDDETKDYKVVLISHFTPHNTSDRPWISIEEYIFRVQVYSLITDSWRLLEGIDSLPTLPTPAIAFNHGVYLKGRYYFLGEYLYEDDAIQDNMILSFDFTKEVFTVIQRPHDYHRPHTISTYQGEKLVVFAEVSLQESYEIWVLNEHHEGGGLKEEQVQESWTKLHELYSTGRPRGISNNGEFAFIGTGVTNEINGVYGDKLELFNLVTKQVKEELSVPQEAIGADVYNQSLVSIGGNTIG